MANDLSGNPIILDTASTTAVLITKAFSVYMVNWAGGAIATTHTVVLQDKLGKKKLEFGTSTADDNKTLYFNPPLMFDGLIAHTIAAGEVHLYVVGPKPQS